MNPRCFGTEQLAFADLAQRADKQKPPPRDSTDKLSNPSPGPPAELSKLRGEGLFCRSVQIIVESKAGGLVPIGLFVRPSALGVAFGAEAPAKRVDVCKLRTSRFMLVTAGALYYLV